MHIRKEKYKELLEVKRDYKAMTKNFLLSFLFGGGICVFGQGLIEFYQRVLNFEDKAANVYMIGTVILIAALLSAFGLYDKIGQIGKAGTVIPISGFSNSMVSSAMEYRPEGFILGIGANVFKLAGSVITLGVVSAYLLALIRYIIEILQQ